MRILMVIIILVIGIILFSNMKNAKIDKDRQLLNIGKKIKLKKRKRILGLF